MCTVGWPGEQGATSQIAATMSAAAMTPPRTIPRKICMHLNPGASIVGLLILAMLAYIALAAPSAPVLPLPPPSKYDARLVQLDRDAIEKAYSEHLVNLFLVWMKDPETDQPRRAVVGARRAQKAYIGAMTEIEKREQELKK